MSVSSLTRVSYSTAAKGARVRAMVHKSANDDAFIFTSRGRYQLVAQTPQVKRALERLPVGASVVSLFGRIDSAPPTSHLKQYKLTSLLGVHRLTSVDVPVSRGADGKFYSGKTELRPMTANAREGLELSARIGSGLVAAVRHGSAIEAWRVINPLD